MAVLDKLGFRCFHLLVSFLFFSVALVNANVSIEKHAVNVETAIRRVTNRKTL